MRYTYEEIEALKQRALKELPHETMVEYGWVVYAEEILKIISLVEYQRLRLALADKLATAVATWNTIDADMSEADIDAICRTLVRALKAYRESK